MDNIYAEPGTKIRYMGADDFQVNWGVGNADPRNLLVEGETYTVKKMEVHSWHTKVTLEEFPNLKFNSAHFED